MENAFNEGNSMMHVGVTRCPAAGPAELFCDERLEAGLLVPRLEQPEAADGRLDLGDARLHLVQPAEALSPGGLGAELADVGADAFHAGHDAGQQLVHSLDVRADAGQEVLLDAPVDLCKSAENRMISPIII
eukprot:scaffold401835_cov44-Prasinocladus_malaysianus.AAC.1